MSTRTITKLDECPGSEESLSIVYCKSTTLLETKKSRLSSSFIRTLSSTMISNSSNQKKRNSDNFNVCVEAPENSSVSESSYTKTSKMAESKRILSFSIYSSNFLYPIDGKENVLMLRENLEASLNETLLTVTQRFLELVNIKLNDSKIAFIKPTIETSLSSLYILKPMKKKSGKPDMDLPGFELGEKVGEINYDAFSIVFSSICVKKHEETEEHKPLDQVICQPRKSFVKSRNEINEKSGGCCQSCVVF